MGVLGTGVATGVAQVALQAQQRGRQQASRALNRAYVLQRQKEVRETRLKGLEEDDAAEAETALHVDGELPDPDRHPDISAARPTPQPGPRGDDDAMPADDEASPDPVTYASPLQPQAHVPPALRHRLDVKA